MGGWGERNRTLVYFVMSFVTARTLKKKFVVCFFAQISPEISIEQSGKSRRRGIVVKDWASKQAKREGSVRAEVSREGPRGGAWRAGRHGEHGEAEEHEDAEAWRRGPRTRGAPRGGRVGDLHAQQLPLQRRGRSQGYRVQQAHGNQGRCEFS